MTTDPAIHIVIADDDEEDCTFAREALRLARVANTVHFVHDGEELMDYLRGTGRYTGAASAARPGLILLDIKMPKLDGFACLAAIKSDESLRRIPVVLLTTSSAEEDIFRGYDLGVNSFITKPVTFDGLVQAMRALGQYWLEIVDLPT